MGSSLRLLTLRFNIHFLFSLDAPNLEVKVVSTQFRFQQAMHRLNKNRCCIYPSDILKKTLVYNSVYNDLQTNTFLP